MKKPKQKQKTSRVARPKARPDGRAPPRQSRWSGFIEWCGSAFLLLLCAIIFIILFIPLMAIYLFCWIEYRIQRESPEERFGFGDQD